MTELYSPGERFTSPSHNDFERLSQRELIRLWNQNNRELLRQMKKRTIPFFGLYGSSCENIRTIQNTHKFHEVLSTFYVKPESPQEFLAMLTHVCWYVLSYGFTNVKKAAEPGGALVLNLEFEGRNKSSRDKPLVDSPDFNVPLREWEKIPRLQAKASA